MAYKDYDCLKIRIDRGVAFITIDHPPINLFDLSLMQEMDRIGQELEADPEVRVIVFDSANPEFFIAHADVTLIQTLPTEVPPKSSELAPFHMMVDRFRTMPKASIAKIEGRARGGGSEFVLSLDMRFAALGKAYLAQPEVAIGIIPGGSGTQRLPRLLGRGRALEVVLGCEDFPADLAERYGYVNRALPPDELGPFVERLAYRIASFPAEAIALVKASVNASELPTREGLLEEAHYFNQSLATKPAQERMARFIELGGQTREIELDLNSLVDKLR
ncbi:MAG: enoyl-CoA hydratase/isomerase family protein [Candidatus Abyssobacteria bacterium SURF_5]|uniref:Enoyl-CoA hydratase/isomerase family protein n=1 Tax=Abyssobacteria bacterium (strain SURF_5) TaxID=2093360 RepID=A0A3A4NGA1_ABYX5|nr:MAG: enoyl-CoA hydratase/isomerase family protein [Candidatus Abyssubacteria bacterium SURF_5]